MLSHEHLKLLLQGVAVVLALHFAKGSMTGEYRNLMAVGLVAVVLMVVNRLFAEYEGMTGEEYERDAIAAAERDAERAAERVAEKDAKCKESAKMLHKCCMKN